MMEKLFNKVCQFLWLIASNGIVAVIASIFIYLALSVLVFLAMIPVSIIAGDEVAQKVMSFLSQDVWQKVLYAIVFISMLIDDLGVPNAKTLIKISFKEKTNKRS